MFGHIAWMQGSGLKEEKHYYPMTFILDPSINKHSPLQIIASRDDFLDTAPKRPGLRDVIFSGRLLREDSETWLYAGLGDAAAGRVHIVAPFSQY